LLLIAMKEAEVMEWAKRWLRLLGWSALAMHTLVACADAGEGGESETGTLRLALLAQSSNATFYGLSGTVLLDDPEALSATFDEFDSAEAVTLTPQVGDYQLELCQNGSANAACSAVDPWLLYQLECTNSPDEGFRECFEDPNASVSATVVSEAVLTSVNPQPVTIALGQEVTAVFQFEVPGEGGVTFGRGMLDVAVAVQAGFSTGQDCDEAIDCQSRVCEDDDGDGTSTCQGATCDDNVLNGDEAGPDCGGSCTAICPSTGIFADSGQRIGRPPWSRGVALGDLDGDGDLDAFFAADGTEPNLVLLNDASGTLVDSGQRLGSLSSQAVELGDVDGDGDLDAVVANWGEDRVWLNDGTGTFTDSGQALSSPNSYGLSLGDVDGDGDLDVFVALDEANQLWLNQGDGTFVDSQQRLGSSFSWDVDLADLDGDGDLDAFVANGEGLEPWANKVWFNDGSGIFTDSGQDLGSGASRGVRLGDVDGDGDFDAFVANSQYEAAEPDRIWLNDGSGSFADSGQRLGSSTSQTVRLGDVDGDGDLDAFVANRTSSNNVWLNDGSGGFSDSGQSIANSNAVDLGDLDGDGDLDAYLGSEVWLNGNGGVFVDSGQALGASDSRSVGLADLDGDGDLDAIVGNYGSPSEVWFNEAGTVTRSDQVLSIAGDAVNSVALGDLDGDGDVDVFLGTSRLESVWLNDGAGNLVESPHRLLSTTLLTLAVVLADLDDDTDLDAFVANAGTNEVWLNDGSAVFSGPTRLNSSSDSGAVALGDLDGDGDIDAFVGNHASEERVWLNDGSGTFSDSGQLLDIGDVWHVRLGDADGDGDLDAFVAYTTKAALWLNDGSGGFSDSGQSLEPVGGSGPNGLAVGDVNQDRDLDVFVANGSKRVWVNDGAGNLFDSGQTLGLTLAPSVQFGDLDLDGDLDVFVANQGPNQVFLNQ
jgi:hypothetical protein